MRLFQYIYLFILLMFLVTSTFADTKNEVIIDCDKARDNPATCVACNIYHESRGESPAGQLAVALVTKNRVESRLYPDNYCAVVWEARRDARTKKLVPMFSWTRDGKHDKVFNEKRWNMALLLAKHVVNSSVHDFTVGSLWYHSVNVTPYWMDHYYPTVRVGDHQFYAAKEEVFLNTLLRNTLPPNVIAALGD